MKKTCKIILALAAYACLVFALTSCKIYKNSEHCDGIVKSYKYIGDTGEYNVFAQLELTFKNNSDTYYPYVIVLDSYFEDYKCESVEELFLNTEFLEKHSNISILKVKNGKATFPINKAIKSQLNVYFYENVSDNSYIVKIDNMNDYIGHFSYTPPLQEELSPQDKGLIKIYGDKVTVNELELKDCEMQYATVNAVSEVVSFDNNYIINVTGKGGYNNGTITCLVSIIVNNGSITEIKGVAVIGWVDQVFIDEITDQFLNSFSDKFEENIYYSTNTGFLVSSATKSSNAICNAVNGAIEYITKNPI